MTFFGHLSFPGSTGESMDPRVKPEDDFFRGPRMTRALVEPDDGKHGVMCFDRLSIKGGRLGVPRGIEAVHSMGIRVFALAAWPIGGWAREFAPQPGQKRCRFSGRRVAV